MQYIGDANKGIRVSFNKIILFKLIIILIRLILLCDYSMRS